MPDRAGLGQRILQALELTADGAALHEHTSWEVCELLTRLQPSDLTPAETMAMAVILAEAHARKLTGVGPRVAMLPIPEWRKNVVG